MSKQNDEIVVSTIAGFVLGASFDWRDDMRDF